MVITSIVLVCCCPASMLFDPRSTYSYSSTYFSIWFDLVCDCMLVLVHISTPVEEPLVVDRVYLSRLLSLVDYDNWMDMIIHDMVGFDINLGMD